MTDDDFPLLIIIGNLLKHPSSWKTHGKIGRVRVFLREQRVVAWSSQRCSWDESCQLPRRPAFHERGAGSWVPVNTPD